MDHRLRVEGMSARRGEDLIFQDISFELTAGEALVVTGPNGSGKSTLLRVVAGLLRPESGSVSWSGARDGKPCEACHFLGHRNAMKRELSVEENLVFWRDFLRDAPGGRGATVTDAIAAVGLAGISHLPFGYLSAGQQRRMAMAKLLVAWRPVWLLDEPTAALDAGADRMFATMIRTHRDKGGIIVAATHQPLGLGPAGTLEMTGFAHAATGEWA